MLLVTRVVSALIACTVAASGAISITSIEPTPLFPRGSPLRQIALVTLRNTGDESVEVELQADASGPVAKVVAAPGTSKHRVLVADREQPAPVRFLVKRAG